MTNEQQVGVVILGGGRGARLQPLTQQRSKPAVPVGGQYRLVDIPVSNAIHSGMNRMGLLTQFNSVSLHRHIASTYTFDPFSRGRLQILAAQQTPNDEGWFQGTADAVRQNLPFIDEVAEQAVLILAGDHIYRMDYRSMLATHRASGARITIAVKPCTEAEAAGFGVMKVDDTGRVVKFYEKPRTAEARAAMSLTSEQRRSLGLKDDLPFLSSMGIYLFDKSVLFEALNSKHNDFGGDVIPAALDRWRVQSHLFDGYWRDIGTMAAFYEAHMDLVADSPPFRFDDAEWPIYTRARFLPCTRLDGSRFDRALLAEGGHVVRSTVSESVVGVRAVIRGATVRRSLIMGCDQTVPAGGRDEPAVGIGEGSVIEGAIIDKNARIGRGVRLVNERGLKDAEVGPVTIRDGIIVVPKNAVVPDGMEL